MFVERTLISVGAPYAPKRPSVEKTWLGVGVGLGLGLGLARRLGLGLGLE